MDIRNFLKPKATAATNENLSTAEASVDTVESVDNKLKRVKAT
jgi:hypothetical protein